MSRKTDSKPSICERAQATLSALPSASNSTTAVEHREALKIALSKSAGRYMAALLSPYTRACRETHESV